MENLLDKHNQEKMQKLLDRFEELESQRHAQNRERLEGFESTGSKDENGYQIYSKKVNSVDDIKQVHEKTESYINTLKELRKLNQELYGLVDTLDD